MTASSILFRAALAAAMLVIQTSIVAVQAGQFVDRVGASALTFDGRKGVGVTRTFMFPKRHLSDPKRFESDPYVPRWSAEMRRARLDEIRQAGFDFLRIAIDPGPLFEAQGEVLDDRLGEIRGAVDSSLAAGLKVVIDMHFSESHELWGIKQVVQSSEGLAFKRYLATLRLLGKIVSDYDPRLVAIEVMNEPPKPCEWRDRPDWPAQLHTIQAAARAAAPRHTILVAGSCLSTIDGLLRLDGSKFDVNTMFVFHYYEPGTFTQQGYWGHAKYRQYANRLPYPPNPAQLQDILQRVDQRIRTAPDIPEDQRARQSGAAMVELQNYFKTRGLADIERDFDRVEQWAAQYRVGSNRIMLGEFGVMKDIFGKQGAAPDDRARWFTDVRATAEKHGYSWAAWALSGTGGIVTGDVDGPLDTKMLEALGLKP